MTFLNYPVEIWVAVFIAVIVRLKTSLTLNWTGALSTILVAIGSGMVLHKPITTLSGIGSEWELLMSILIALTAENLMKKIVDFSEDDDAVKNIVGAIVKKDFTKVFSKDSEKGGEDKK